MLSNSICNITLKRFIVNLNDKAYIESFGSKLAHMMGFQLEGYAIVPSQQSVYFTFKEQ